LLSGLLLDTTQALPFAHRAGDLGTIQALPFVNRTEDLDTARDLPPARTGRPISLLLKLHRS
jgi:hypothetical protein